VESFLTLAALLLAALFLLRLAGWLRSESGLPTGDIVSSDTRAWGVIEAPLVSQRLGLTGRPDYLVREHGRLVPIEVKSAAAPMSGPHQAHVLQLAAYCALVAEVYGERPAYGLIKYRDRLLRVPYTDALERELRATLDEMRTGLGADGLDRSHEHPGRCRGCGLREACDQAL
jgi:CRISPR-associated exonuclease Cas4